MYLQDSIRGINTLDYTNVFNNITLEYVNRIKKEMFKDDMQAISIIRKK